MATALWVVFCTAALAAVLLYLVIRRPGPWLARDRADTHPYVIDPDADEDDELLP